MICPRSRWVGRPRRMRFGWFCGAREPSAKTRAAFSVTSRKKALRNWRDMHRWLASGQGFRVPVMFAHARAEPSPARTDLWLSRARHLAASRDHRRRVLVSGVCAFGPPPGGRADREMRSRRHAADARPPGAVRGLRTPRLPRPAGGTAGTRHTPLSGVAARRDGPLPSVSFLWPRTIVSGERDWCAPAGAGRTNLPHVYRSALSISAWTTGAKDGAARHNSNGQKRSMVDLPVC
ncbi:hypothetical protein FH063_004260 [Azospirillum argentinense]|uniref:Uncharacterized protein n=1 Tax=Azospirillum argentinense TaxID=2970906 RepID=A0A5B0KL18_9PROT|nr:hypothetical protein FH063_004260 [Azospirillum argentinense]